MSRLLASITTGLCVLAAPALLYSAGSRSKPRLETTLVVPQGWNALAVADLDANGKIDYVFMDQGRRTLRIYEQSKDSFALTAALLLPEEVRGSSVGDVDGDGYPEMVTRGIFSSDVWIIEARKQGGFGMRRMAMPMIFATTAIADTDGDGKLEIVAGQSGFPTRMHRFIGDGNDRYKALPPHVGHGGELRPAFGDRPGSLVMVDTHFWRDVHRLRFYERGKLSISQAKAGMIPRAIVDMDGDGNLELLGRHYKGDKVLLERVGNRFVERYRGRPGNCAGWATVDVDGDGTEELPCIEGDRIVFKKLSDKGTTDVVDTGSSLRGFVGTMRVVARRGRRMIVRRTKHDWLLHVLRF